jgi:hypothetical protein
MEIKHLMGWIGRHAGSLAIYYGTGRCAEVALELLFAWNRVPCRPPLAGNEVAQSWTASRGYITRTATEPEFRPVNQVISFLFH